MKPYIILNCAASIDGKIALPNRQKLSLSNKEDFARVHSLRAKCDAIIVGIDTIIQDDPSLTVNQKYSSGENPLRIILDTNYRTPANSQILDNKNKTLIAIGEKTIDKSLENVEIIRCGNEEINLEKLMINLVERGIEKVMVEGGETVLWSFLEKELFDELNVFVSSVIVGGKNTPTVAGGKGYIDEQSTLKLNLKNINRIGNGILLQYSKSKN